MTKSLKTGDKVTWKASEGNITGTVMQKMTKTAKVKNHTAKATPQEPQYKVKSDKTGATAFHKPDSLHKKS